MTLHMTDDKIILFPTDRIVNKETAKQNPEGSEKVRVDRTKEFVEGNVDDIAYKLLDKFSYCSYKDTFSCSSPGRKPISLVDTTDLTINISL